jgi:hypothetical protein
VGSIIIHAEGVQASHSVKAIGHGGPRKTPAWAEKPLWALVEAGFNGHVVEFKVPPRSLRSRQALKGAAKNRSERDFSATW